MNTTDTSSTRRVSRSQKGFTLIESLVALFFLAISMLAMAQLMLVSLDKTEFAKYDTKAINLAQAKLEELRNQFGWEIDTGEDSADLAAGPHGPDLVVLELPGETLQGLRNFQVTWEVTDLPYNQKAISVSVAPQTVNPRQTETITIETVMTP